MRLTRPAAFTLVAALLAPALATAGGRAESERLRSPEASSMAASAFQRQQELVLLQVAAVGERLSERSAALLSERARLARRFDQLQLVVDDGLALLEAQSQGLVDPEDGHEILLRSPSAVLAREESRPSVLSQGGAGGRKWTRGSWMDSPDGA